MDLDSVSELVDRCVRSDVSFAICFYPGEADGHFFACDTHDTIISNIGSFDFKSTDCFVITEYGIGSEVNLYAIPALLTIGDIESRKSGRGHLATSIITPDTHSTSKQDHEDAVTKLIESFSDTNSKTVLSRIKCVNSHDTPWGVAQRFFKKHIDCFRHISWTPYSGLWFGCTPEVLLKYDASQMRLSTMSLAGTRNSSAKDAWDEKNTSEHNLVTDHIVTTLKQNGLTPEVSDSINLQFGGITHLCHMLHASGEVNLNKVIADLSPTPAVCGFPRQSANDAIFALESFSRKCYAGIVGTTTESTARLFVNLRCALSDITPDDRSRYTYNLYAGGGINKLSLPETEWDETEAKMKSLLSCIDRIE